MQTDKYQEEFKSFCSQFANKPTEHTICGDWWISKMQQRDRELVENLEECLEKLNSQTAETDFSRGGKAMLEEILALIQSNNKENGK